MKCNGDCWNCENEGCVNLTLEEIKQQDIFDKEVEREKKNLSKKQIQRRRYDKSLKGKECKRRYYQKEKKRYCENSKNYYERNKEQVIEYVNRWNKANVEKTNKYKAKYMFKKRFVKKNGREPEYNELKEWENGYELRRKKGDKVC